MGSVQVKLLEESTPLTIQAAPIPYGEPVTVLVLPALPVPPATSTCDQPGRLYFPLASLFCSSLTGLAVYAGMTTHQDPSIAYFFAGVCATTTVAFACLRCHYRDR